MSTDVVTAGRIVVGTDGSQRADKAVHWAAGRAAARKLPLLILNVVPRQQMLAADTIEAQAWFEASPTPGMVQVAQEKLDQLVASLRTTHPDLDVTGVALVGHPSNVLAEASRDADQVVVGARGATAPLTVRMLGGVSDAVTAHAHGPIVVISDEADEHPRGPVVVGVDDSEASAAAIKIAFEAASVRGVPLVAVHAFVQLPDYEAAWDEAVWATPTTPVSSTRLEATLTDRVEELLAGQMAQHPDVRVEVRVLHARPREALVLASEDAGLLVIGSRGRGGFGGLLLGSTSKYVIREAHCPVLVTRAEPA